MPKFAPNTGFRMPGLGSKEKNSASNFRDEHHVDKVGYCDNTPDEMLPSGSSPLSYKPIVDDDPYTSARYSGELAVNIPDPRPKTREKEEGGSTVYNITNNNGRLDEIGKTGKNTDREKISNTTAATTTKSKYKGPKMSDEAWAALTPAKRREMNAAVGADKKGDIKKTTPGVKTTVYKVNNVIVDKATYDAANSGKSKETK